MNIQQFSDRVSEAIFMNIEEVTKIEEQSAQEGVCHIVQLETGEKFIITIVN